MVSSVEGTALASGRRADARRSIEAIVAAALAVFNEHPDASMEDVALRAGVSRQTVYAHFASRDALVQAIVGTVAAEATAAFEAARLGGGTPAAALDRFLDICWQFVRRYPLLLGWSGASVAGSGHDPHGPILTFLEQLFSRGQASGDFDRVLSPAWLATAVLELGHSAAEQVAAGRLTADDAEAALRTSVARLCGMDRLAD
jgi:AcrR family transcriptional regulator